MGKGVNYGRAGVGSGVVVVVVIVVVVVVAAAVVAYCCCLCLQSWLRVQNQHPLLFTSKPCVDDVAGVALLLRLTS